MAAFRLLGAVAFALALCAGAADPAQLRERQAAVQPAPPTAPGQAPAEKSPEMRIAAVVNDEVISVFDVVSRMRMVMISSNIADSPEMRQRIAPQVLHSLIDEKLELQEAKRQSVTATDSEVNTGLQQIEKQNNMKSGQLNELLKSRGIDRGALVDQLTAGIVWAKLVRRQAAQTTEITDEEVDEALKRAKEHANEPQSRVAEIFLAVDNPAQDGEVHSLAERLTQQMRQGSRFSAIAQQFSQSATAAVGGDIGWLRPDPLPPVVGKAVSGLRPGEMSAPDRVAGAPYLSLDVDRPDGNSVCGQDTFCAIMQVV